MTRATTWRGWGRLIGAVVGLTLAWLWITGQPHSVAEAGLGRGTAGISDQHPRGQVYHRSAAEAASTAGLTDGRRKILWLGASQLYSINGYRTGQHTAPYLLFERMLETDNRVLAVAHPNMFPEEHWVVLEYLLASARLDLLVIGAVYDDMREGGLRDWVAEAARIPAVRGRLERTDAGRRLIAQADAATSGVDQGAEGGGKVTLMDRSERWIVDRLEAWMGAETLRSEGRGWAILTLSDMRRWLESLRARYTRDLANYRVPIPAERYQANRRAWEAMMATAREHGTKVLVYVPPRPTDFFPYDPAAYAAFKDDIAGLAAAHGASFVNLEDLVPSQQFGEVDLNFGFWVRDPFHFQATAHESFAAALLPEIQRHLTAVKGDPR